MAAGVAAGIADHLGISVLRVRVAFMVLLGLSGLGLLLYAAFWAVVPLRPGDTAVPPRRDVAQLLPFVAIGLGVAADPGDGLRLGRRGGHRRLAGRHHRGRRRGHLAPVRARTAPAVGRRRCRCPGWARSSRRATGGPSCCGSSAAGCWSRSASSASSAVYSPAQNFAAVVNGVIFALVGLAGVGVVAAPVLWRMFSQLRAEREGRIREQERAELAAMVHDQVLHTLALIQRNAGDVKTVQRLARGQERSPAQLALQADRVADRALRRRAGAGRRRGRGHLRDHRGDGRGRRPGDRRAGRRAGRGRPGGAGQRGPARRGADRVALRRGGAGSGQRLRPRPGRRASIRIPWRTTGTAYAARSSGG